jgi:RNA polymerase sigma-70 factor (ECF subfamily)
MADENIFSDFLRRVRSGDATAAEQLVRRYERAVRVAVRARLGDPALRQAFDSMDVCQSVMASFFVRAAAGQYDLHEPNHLVGLLVRMAQNKLAMRARHSRQQCRDSRRLVTDPEVLAAVPDGPGDPARVAAGRELLDMVRERLGAEERAIAEMRAAGREWADVAAELGGTAEGRRKQFGRALDRIAAELGLDDPEDEPADEPDRDRP